MSKKQNKAEKEHYKKVAALGCIICRLQGYHDTPAEIHHIRTGSGMGQRSSNFDVIPLCPVHHRLGYKDKKEGIEEFGYHQSPARFEESYGTELELLETTRGLL